ncbi:MAG: rhamnulokinase [Actinomycetales bacterium]
MVHVAAADLGASSGRVVLGDVGPDRLGLTETHRFATRTVDLAGTLHWDTTGLYLGILDGIRAAARKVEPLAGIGIDSWAVDYGLLDSTGQLLGMPVCYRDSRTAGIPERAFAQVPADEVYATTGIQRLAFNTAMQLISERDAGRLTSVETMLMLPDLFGYWLTGDIGCERTNASSTQLYDPVAGDWAWSLIERWNLSRGVFPALREPGSLLGPVRPTVAADLGLDDDVPVVAVASHDTASAVVAVPAEQENFAYVSCGTWSLVGVELDKPVLTDASMVANFTNEVGLDDTIRYLRNVMGLWLLTQCQRTWERTGHPADLAELLRAAGQAQPLRSVVDTERPEFLPPGDMPARIAQECRRTGQPEPRTPGEMVRCILDSLALAYRRAVQDAQRLSGAEVEVIHVVGGGSRNDLLMQSTADACGLPVVAGPVEASALGNVLVQGRALGAVDADLSALRQLVRRTHRLTRFEPRSTSLDWNAAELAAYGPNWA